MSGNQAPLTRGQAIGELMTQLGLTLADARRWLDRNFPSGPVTKADLAARIRRHQENVARMAPSPKFRSRDLESEDEKDDGFSL